MNNNEINKKLEKDKKVTLVSEIKYRGKKYVKTIKSTRNGIEYLYYEIDNNEIKDIEDEMLVSYFKEKYEHKPTNIIY